MNLSLNYLQPTHYPQNSKFLTYQPLKGHMDPKTSIHHNLIATKPLPLAAASDCPCFTKPSQRPQ